jgi:branched-chain amino acid aminotransferase
LANFGEITEVSELLPWPASLIYFGMPNVYNQLFSRKGAGKGMPIQHTGKIWHNGNLIPWDRAQIHVMSHVIHYGSSVFEGIRCYGQPSGAAVFRLPEHMQRLLDSAKIYRMPMPYSLDQLSTAVVELVEANGVAPCYIRPIAFRGYGEMGVNPKH